MDCEKCYKLSESALKHLPCAHTVCLTCLQSARELLGSSRCPVCYKAVHQQQTCRICGERPVTMRRDLWEGHLCATCGEDLASSPLAAGSTPSRRASAPTHAAELACVQEDMVVVCTGCPDEQQPVRVVTLAEQAGRLRGKLAERKEDLLQRKRALEAGGAADKVTRLHTEVTQLETDVQSLYDALTQQLQEVAGWHEKLSEDQQFLRKAAVRMENAEQLETQLASLERADDVTVVQQCGQLLQTKLLSAANVDTICSADSRVDHQHIKQRVQERLSQVKQWNHEDRRRDGKQSTEAADHQKFLQTDQTENQ